MMSLAKHIFKMGRTAAAGCAGVFIAIQALAQAPEPVAAQPQIPSRFLFIFSTSAGMKARLPAMQQEITTLFSSSMHGELHAGDSMGIWTFASGLHTGQMPLIEWSPAGASAIAKGLDKFLAQQRYAHSNDFSVLEPLLDQVIATSPRLTILIFCDGEGQITGTPYDDQINQIFSLRFAALKQAKQPFVIVLRTQQGRYVGSSINFPPGMVNLPDFPPLVETQPPATNPPVASPPPAPAPAPLPIYVLGTRIFTNREEFEAEKKIYEKTRADMMRSNAILAAAAVTNVASTNSPGNPDRSRHDGMIAMVAGFLIAVAALTALLIFRSRQADRGSLISRSLEK